MRGPCLTWSGQGEYLRAETSSVRRPHRRPGILGLGLVVPAVTACSSSSGDETEQVEEDSSSEEGETDSGDTEETEPESDIEE